MSKRKYLVLLRSQRSGGGQAGRGARRLRVGAGAAVVVADARRDVGGAGGGVVFGSGLAVVPFLHGGVVTTYGWLTERQFLDAVAVSMITPGPVVITVAFIGTLVAGLLGGTVAALGMFVPTWGAVVLLAPGFRRIMASPVLRAAVDGVTAAAAGALAGAVVVLGRRALVDPATWLIGIATLVLLWKVRRIPEPLLIVAAGVVGLVLRSA